MKTKLNYWDAFINHMENIFYKDVLNYLNDNEIDFYWNEFINS